MEYPIITKRSCRENRVIRSIQKESRKLYKISRREQRISKREMSAKAKINKVVAMKLESWFADLTKEEECNSNTNRECSSRLAFSLNNTMTVKELLNKLDELQIRGLSGSGYKTAEKIRTLLESEVKNMSLLINAVECEPGLVHDEWLLHNQFQTIQEGIKVLTQSIPFNKVYIATKKISDKVREGIQKEIPSQAEIVTVPYYYPIGEEHNLIQYITGKQLKREEIPAKKGILVVNVQTVYTIAMVMKEDKVQQSRFLTVANLVEGKATVVKANFGMKVVEVAKKILGSTKGLTLYCGGGVMNAHRATLEDVIDEHMNFIGYQREIHYTNTNRCKGCGACERNCPANIPIKHIIKALEQNKQSEVRQLLTGTCLRCGACTYHCAAGKNTMELIAKEEERYER